jgi:hypothetical protein
VMPKAVLQLELQASSAMLQAPDLPTKGEA